MKFEDALKTMREGKIVKLGDYIHFIEGETIYKHRIADNFKLLGHLYYDEILSEDWEVVEDECE